MTLKTATIAAMLGVGLLAQTKSTPALACNMRAISSAERLRYNELTADIKTSVRVQTELTNGFSWDLDGRKASVLQVAEWMSMERRCCPFLTMPD